VSLYVAEADGRAARAGLARREGMNPASVMKLVTTYAALDLLGPPMSGTPVYVDGNARRQPAGQCLYAGRGDPKLVMERLWLMLRRLQGMGVKVIVGDIVLDRSAFAPAGPRCGGL
jgi:D-alanyl-D-alanine carboxypeptidase/D-alanyl-D-alanine-endopeptidase (penicillin-binding protein 4)